ncbi:MAG: DUF1028 domain-containing protein [Actinomycetia bacterium]|nr:DUF1028 domain-containing protein [Actinomycetes bacterium]
MFRRLLIVVSATVAMFSLGLQAAQATWSVVGVDAETGEVGVAVASCVGFEVSVVPVLVPGMGAAASQADISANSGERFVESIKAGATAVEVVDIVVAADEAPEDRQFGVVVLGDGGAGWTGSGTFDVALDRRSSDGTVSAQGNILVSQDVVDAAIAAFEVADGDLADRLVAGLVAGADAGGDSRCGEQTARAAALIVARPSDDTYAFTDAGVLGVDPDVETVPSVFVSVLVAEGGDRAPDRLAEAWRGADRSASTVTIRQVDDGANSALGAARNIVLVLLGLVAAVVVVVIVVVIRSRRRTRAS